MIIGNFLHLLVQATNYPGLCEPTSQGGLGFDYFVNVSASEMWLWFLENVPDHEWSMSKVTNIFIRNCGIFSKSYGSSKIDSKFHFLLLEDCKNFNGKQTNFK